MAGKHRRKRDRSTDVGFTIRMPGALKADLQDAALEHGVSLNEEMLRRMMSPQKVYRAGLSREQWNAMMELEPQPDDDRSDAEIARQMERINPGHGTIDVADYRPSAADDAATLAEITLLPGSGRF